MRPLSALRRRALDLVERGTDHPAYLLLLMLLAFATTATASLPYTVILVAAVLPAPRRWLLIALVSALGSAGGATLMFKLFQHWGWAEIVRRFPELAGSGAFASASDWLDAWGLPALTVIAASPFPQTPALFLCAIGNATLAGVFLAILVGKLLKYSLLAWIAAQFPQRVAHLARAKP